MKYNVTVSTGCTATGIAVNDKEYFGEDARYTMTDAERDTFHNYLFEHLRKEFDAGCVNLWSLLELLTPEDQTYSDTCDQCGDYVTTTTYEIE
jgi:hypothetical protein